MFQNAVQQLANQIKKSKSQLVVLGETHILSEHRYFSSCMISELKKQGFNTFFYEMDHHLQPGLSSIHRLPVHDASYEKIFADNKIEKDYLQTYRQLGDSSDADRHLLLEKVFNYEQQVNYNFLSLLSHPVSAHQVFNTAFKNGYNAHLVDCNINAYAVDSKQQDIAKKKDVIPNGYADGNGNNVNVKGLILRNHFMADQIQQHLSKGGKGIAIVGNDHTHDMLVDNIIVPSIKYELVESYNIPTFSCMLGDYYINFEKGLKNVNLLNKFTRNPQKIFDLHYINGLSVIKPEISSNSLPDSHVIFPDPLLSEIYDKYTGGITHAFTENKTQLQIDAWNTLCKKDSNNKFLIK